jgi:hypothetical protein
MSYTRFGFMILTSTLLMFILMYLNTDAWEHVFFSETRAYMAILMGATMALVMLAFMASMYPSQRVNAVIFTVSALVVGLSLWLVRSQATVSVASYMRAMIPHHSIAVMTSERARIRDPRVRKLADEIVSAQRREIAEMRYLIAHAADGRGPERIYEDPPATVGSIEDALSHTLIATLDPTPLSAAEAQRVVQTVDFCRFGRSAEGDPIFWASTDGSAGAMKLNGVLVRLEGSGDGRRFGTRGAIVSVDSLDDEDADWRANAELAFALDAGLTAGYRGFYSCEAR